MLSVRFLMQIVMRLIRVMCMLVCALVAMIMFMAMVFVLFTLFMLAVIIGVFMHRNALRCIMIVRVFFRVVRRMAAVKIVAMGQVQIELDIQRGESLNAVIFWLIVVAS